jgi:hypothetical protein
MVDEIMIAAGVGEGHTRVATLDKYATRICVQVLRLLQSVVIRGWRHLYYYLEVPRGIFLVIIIWVGVVFKRKFLLFGFLSRDYSSVF